MLKYLILTGTVCSEITLIDTTTLFLTLLDRKLRSSLLFSLVTNHRIETELSELVADVSSYVTRLIVSRKIS